MEALGDAGADVAPFVRQNREWFGKYRSTHRDYVRVSLDALQAHVGRACALMCVRSV